MQFGFRTDKETTVAQLWDDCKRNIDQIERGQICVLWILRKQLLKIQERFSKHHDIIQTLIVKFDF